MNDEEPIIPQPASILATPVDINPDLIGQIVGIYVYPIDQETGKPKPEKLTKYIGTLKMYSKGPNSFIFVMKGVSRPVEIVLRDRNHVQIFHYTRRFK